MAGRNLIKSRFLASASKLVMRKEAATTMNSMPSLIKTNRNAGQFITLNFVTRNHSTKCASCGKCNAVGVEPESSSVPPAVTSVSLCDEYLSVEWASDGVVDKYPFVWIRDNCQCPDCFHPVSLARRVVMHWLDVNDKPAKAEYCSKTNKVLVTWQNGHVSPLDPTWLRDRSFSNQGRNKWQKLVDRREPIHFDASDPIRRHDFKGIMEDDRKLLDWLMDLDRVGLTMLYGMDEPDSLPKLASRVGFTKTTHYGDFFEVHSKGDPNNLAYTSSTLGLHLDEPHYYYTPSTQFLHCMKQWAMEGGSNEFVDGFKVANELREKHPEQFKLLSTIPVYFWDIGVDEFVGEFNKIRQSPTLKLGPDGEIERIHLSNHHRDSYVSAPVEMVKPWYEALKLFTSMCYSEENLVHYKMKEGECSVFDNLRVLHGRRGYKLEDGGHRHLKGCYMDWDEIHSKMNVLLEKFNGKNRAY